MEGKEAFVPSKLPCLSVSYLQAHPNSQNTPIFEQPPSNAGRIRRVNQGVSASSYLPSHIFLTLHIYRLSAAIIMKVTYGYEIESHNDKHVSIAENAVQMLSDSTVPGAMLVNILPIRVSL